jgi:hypothetical protein
LGRKALITSSLQTKNGPCIKSIQYGIAGKTASKHSFIDFGFPGRFTISEDPLKPAVCLERIAVGTNFKDSALISSPNPGIILSHTASVASGVTSLKAGPVPPVVTTKQHFSLSTKSFNVSSIVF